MVSDKHQQLVSTLKELFMMDQADLNFGIYRIMNAKHNEIESFLTNDLLTSIRQTLQTTGKASNTKKELDDAIKSAQALGMNPDDSPKVQELKALLGNGAENSLENDENEIFSQLTTFFSRYYDGGDFMSLRRYKKETYSPLPMNGEEVKLHWANADQYYIKNAENFSQYAFKIGEENQKKHFRFELLAASTEQNNVKATEDKERRFILDETNPLAIKQTETGAELHIHFSYQADAKKRKQKELNLAAIKFLSKLDANNPLVEQVTEWTTWQTALLSLIPTAKNKTRTALEKHLNDYTAKNSFDYFIHKDLGGFLRRELDFFIKNELLLLDDLVPSSIDILQNQLLSNERSLKKVIAFKGIAQKLIAFLAQLENFQKKLWLKKKFVLEMNYCISLNRIPNKLTAQVMKSEDQKKEWVELYGIDRPTLEKDYQDGKLEEFFELPQYKFLIVDTKNFSLNFKHELLASFDNIDDECEGLLINSDNFQATQLIAPQYASMIGAIITDPPYNTDDDGFLYKDSFQHSTWMSMIQQQLLSAKPMLAQDAWLSLNINDIEQHRLVSLLEEQDLSPASVISIKMSHMSGMKMAHADRKPPKIKETIVISPLSKNSRINPVYEQCSWWDSFDRYTSFLIKNDSNDPKDWTRTSVRKVAIEQGINVKDLTQYEQFCINNAHLIFQRAKNDSVAHFPKDGYFKEIITPTGLKKIILDAKEVLFAKNYLKEFNGELVPVNIKGDIWDDIGINNSHNEGGISFENGKKPVKLFERLTAMLTPNNSIVMDLFGGSGTLPHAVMNLNNKGAKRKYIAIEMAEYFESIMLKRIKKISYKAEWLAGKPQLLSNSSSVFFKTIKLESYEDVQDNLQLQRTTTQAGVFDNPENKALKEDYLLHYMLDIEAQDSLLSPELFINPFNATMRVVRDNESRTQSIDLVETFNYLLGLRVKTYRHSKGIVEVTGKNPQDQQILILWRDCVETDNDALDNWFKKQNYNSRDMEFDLIYVNGDNNLPNLRTGEETWKVQLIEEIFQTLMFDVKDV